MKTLKQFEFKTFGSGARYDWDKILDGAIHQLEEGKDYQCTTQTIATMCRNQARKRGMTIKSGTVEGGIVVQAVKASPEQLKAWAEADAQKQADAE
jgi:hypothetical protein